MIEGIEILNKTEIMDTPGWLGWVIGIGAIVITLIIAVGLGLLLSVDELISSIVTAVIVGIYVVIMCNTYLDSIPTGRYQYEVTMDESVPFEKLYEQYDVIEQRGNIWVIEDKEKTSE